MRTGTDGGGGARAWPLALALLAAAGSARAQSFDPRSFVNTPVGINFVSGGYGYSTGNVLFDPAIPLTNADLTIQGPSGGYARAIDAWGLSGKADAALGWACANGTADVIGGGRKSRQVCGLTDPTMHVSVNLLGAPALTMRQFPTYHQKWLMGAGFRVTMPLGQYAPAYLLNIGTNRWSFKTDVGVSRALGRATVEFLGAVTLFTTNPDFFGGHVQSQEPLYSTQLNVTYTFRSGIWGTVGGIYYAGGATTVDDEAPSTRQENTRAGAMLVFPIGRQNSLKVYYTSGVTTRTGSDFDQVVAIWTHLWGGKR
jgi:hypothetical protein